MDFVAKYVDDIPEAWQRPLEGSDIDVVQEHMDGNLFLSCLVFSCPDCPLAHDYMAWLGSQPRIRGGHSIIFPLLQNPQAFIDDNPSSSMLAWTSSMNSEGFPGWAVLDRLFYAAPLEVVTVSTPAVGFVFVSNP